MTRHQQRLRMHVPRKRRRRARERKRRRKLRLLAAMDGSTMEFEGGYLKDCEAERPVEKRRVTILETYDYDGKVVGRFTDVRKFEGPYPVKGS